MNPEITPVESLRKPFVLAHDERIKRMAQTIELPADFIADIEARRRKATEIGAIDKFNLVWGITIKFLPLLFNVLWSCYMKNWKTTIAAAVAFLVALLAHFGFEVSADVQTVIVSAGLLAVGYFAKDASNNAPVAPAVPADKSPPK